MPSSPSSPSDRDVEFLDATGPAVDDVVHRLDQVTPSPAQDGTFDIGTLSEAQIQQAFDSALSEPRDETALARRQELWSMATRHAGLGSAASARPTTGLIQWNPPVLENSRKGVVQGRVDAPADLKATLEAFRSKVLAATNDPGTAVALAQTLEVIILFTQNIGEPSRPKTQADADALMRAFHVHVGPNSFPGLNAACALRAFDATDLTTLKTAPARIEDDVVINPFGFDEIQLARLEDVRGGDVGLAYADKEWRNLMPWLSRDQVYRVLSKPVSRTSLEGLQSAGPTLMLPCSQGGLGMTVEQLVDVAAEMSGGVALRALLKTGTLLAKSRSEGGLGMSLPQLLRVAPRGGQPVLEALRDVGEALFDMGFTTEDMADLGYRGGRAETIRAIASMQDDVADRRVTIGELKTAGMKALKPLDAVLALRNPIP